MANARVRALAAGLAAQAIRDVIPTDSDLIDAELFRPEDGAQVVQELERLANQLLAEALKLESI
ncbi:hypothetical protein EA796_06915 [Pseudomonas sp. AOB-7]|nr:hypothetical protein EA796_06915 [Pseudomonas sp. AOB-7]